MGKLTHINSLYLRRITACDVPKLFEWRNDSSLWKWCRQHDVLHPASHMDWFDKQSKDPSVSMYVVAKNKLPVGVCGLTSIDNISRKAEFSLYIGPEFQGQGIGIQALSLLFDKGFYDLNLKMIWGEALDGNPAMKMFDAIGMTRDGIRRKFYFKDGKYLDAHLFSVLKEEWDKAEENG